MSIEHEPIREFAEKIAKFCSQRGLKVLLDWLDQQRDVSTRRSFPLKVMHLPFIDISSSKRRSRATQKPPTLIQRPISTQSRVKQLKTITVDLNFRTKPLPNAYKNLYQAAHDAHRCCRSQDIHLFRLKQIYEEKRLSLKDVIDWKLPKSIIFKKQLDYYVDQIRSFHNSDQNHHHITLILIGRIAEKKRAEEKQKQEHLELDKQQSEKRNYTQRSIFN